MATIKSLDNISFDELFHAFNAAFEDYEFQLTKCELERMLKRRGFVPQLSFGAFEADSLKAFILNGIGQFNGVLSAYDTGTGTLKEYRGKGLIKEIFNNSMPELQAAGALPPTPCYF